MSRPSLPLTRPRPAVVVTALVFVLAGIMFAAAATTSQGTDLRAQRAVELRDLVRQQSERVESLDETVTSQQAVVDDLTSGRIGDPAAIIARSGIAALEEDAGMTPVTDRALTVTLDDAPLREPDDPLWQTLTPDDVIVHQADVQAVINALWRGGATAMQVMDQRVIATSSVQCVGNTLLLNGRVYSPPSPSPPPDPSRGCEPACATTPVLRRTATGPMRSGSATTCSGPPSSRSRHTRGPSRWSTPLRNNDGVVRILVVDNYDSFVFNLVQYLAQLGADVTVRRNDEVTPAEACEYDGVLLSPGPGTPEEAGVCMDIVRECAGRVPIFGVCLGHQAIAASYGATVSRAPELLHGKTSLVVHEDAGVLAGLPSPFTATRYHSLAVEPATVPDELVVTGRTEGGVIMAIRHRDLAVEGVQFHPESVLTEGGHAMLANWLAECGDPDARERATHLAPVVG